MRKRAYARKTYKQAFLYEYESTKPLQRGPSTLSTVQEAKALGMALGVSCLNGIEEAEAQCALLNSESLCDGCFSSDSDIFFFGARTVYREICLGDGGYVVCYEMAEIENKLGLGRDSLIALSLLLGSDYHQGVHDSNFKPFKLVFTTKICNGTKADEEEAFS
ncbi:hypothetical protein RYX36_011968, partial [Vicia faba]